MERVIPEISKDIATYENTNVFLMGVLSGS